MVAIFLIRLFLLVSKHIVVFHNPTGLLSVNGNGGGTLQMKQLNFAFLMVGGPGVISINGIETAYIEESTWEGLNSNK